MNRKIFFFLLPIFLFGISSFVFPPNYIHSGVLNYLPDTILLKSDGDYKSELIKFDSNQHRLLVYDQNRLLMMTDFYVDSNSNMTLYVNGKQVKCHLNGLEVLYNRNGSISTSAQFKMGSIYGVRIVNDTNGRPLLRDYYDSLNNTGELIRSDFYVHNQLSYSDSFSELGIFVKRTILQKDLYKQTRTVQFGKRLYETNNCNSCHGLYKNVIGPPLAGIGKKEGKDFAFQYIKNNLEFRQRSKKAQRVYVRYGGMAMNIFNHIPDDDIKLIVEYLDSLPAKK